jgi:hypothetical protein
MNPCQQVWERSSLSRVPADVRCVEIFTSDWLTQHVRVNVEPGTSQSIRLAPLKAGTILLSGQAYDSPCVGYDAGLQQTWEADRTIAYVEPGRITHAQLTFRRFGGVQVEIDFQEPCPCEGGSTVSHGDGGVGFVPDASDCACEPPDAPPYWPPGFDAGAASR